MAVTNLDKSSSTVSITQTQEDDFIAFGNLTTYVAQSFKVPTTSVITQISVKLSKENSPTDAVQMAIYSDSNGTPGSVLETSSDTVDGTTLGSGFGNPTLCNFSFNQTLTSNTTYWCVLSRTGSPSANLYNIFTSVDTTDQYTDGDMYRYNGTWTSVSVENAPYTYDFYFQITGTPAVLNLGKNAASPKRYSKSGSAWNYDQGVITYDGVTDPDGRTVYYDSLGTAPVITNLTKHAA